MQKLQLYIDSDYDLNVTTYQRVDLFKDETVSMTQSIQNVKDIDKIFTEFTKTFTIPASPTNNKLFRHYNNFDIVNTFDARNRVDAKIELNNIPFKKGTIRLEGTELKNNKIYAYKITFFGQTVNLKTLLEDDQLADLGSLDSLSLDYTDSNIRAKLVSSLGAIITPLITHTDQLFYNSASSTQGNGNLHFVSASSDNQVKWSQLKFAIRLIEIIEAIESKYTIANNYANNIVFSDDFFTSSNTPFYNLYMWLHRKKGDVEPAQQVSLQFRQVSNFSLFSFTSNPGQQTNLQNGAITVIGDLVTYPNNIIGHSLSFIPPNNTAVYNIIVYRGSTIHFQESNLTGTKIYTESNFAITAGTYTIFVASATTIVFASGNIRWSINGNLGGEIINGTWTDEYRISGIFTTSTTFQFSILQQIPKMKIIDFLTSLFKMFNLTAFIDDSGTIVVKTLDSFYSSSSQVWELDEFIDTSKRQVNVALPFKEIGFQFKGLKTFLAVQYNQLENSGWGSLAFSLEQAKYTAPGDSYLVEIPFEHMQYERLVNQTGAGDTDIQWGWSVNDNKESFHGLPLIFYAIRQTNSSTPISFGFDSGTKVSLNTFIIPSNSLSIDPAVSKKNIHFQNETNEYTNSTAFTETLFSDYYTNYISDVFSNARRLIKVGAFLPLKIIYNLELNDKVSIGNQQYIINSLKTNLINGKSDIELLNVVSNLYRILPNVLYSGSLGRLFYNSSIGNASNLAVGNFMFNDSALSVSAASGTYTQASSNASDTHCSGSGAFMSMTLDGSGRITAISCQFP